MPVNRATAIQARVQSLLPSAGQPGTSAGAWTPNTDVYIGKPGLVIKVELAGVRPADLNVVVEGSRLRVRGARADGSRTPACRFLVMEIHFGPFEVSVEVPSGYDAAGTRATYQDGFLCLEVPRSAACPEGPRHIPIEPGGI